MRTDLEIENGEYLAEFKSLAPMEHIALLVLWVSYITRSDTFDFKSELVPEYQPSLVNRLSLLVLAMSPWKYASIAKKKNPRLQE